MNVFVTGQPGVGKTTLIVNVCKRLREAYPDFHFYGFFTEELRSRGDRIGFDVETLDGKRSPLARSNSAISQNSAVRVPKVGKYSVDVNSFESLAIPEIEIAINGGCGLLVLDEVGKMELFSKAFFPKVWEALNSSVIVFGSVPMLRSGVEINQVSQIKHRSDVELFKLTKENRDAIAIQIYGKLESIISNH